MHGPDEPDLDPRLTPRPDPGFPSTAHRYRAVGRRRACLASLVRLRRVDHLGRTAHDLADRARHQPAGPRMHGAPYSAFPVKSTYHLGANRSQLSAPTEVSESRTQVT
ncbi:hypothetical protein P3T27_001197 [Kitasatospora sp. MAA19]|nr:hypothetical protein [Kitasatospora sp. MAA19]